MVRAVLLLGVIVTLMASARAFVGSAEPPFGSGVSLAFGFLVLAAYMAGEAITSFRLPKLTGYLFLGLACGPSATNLVTPAMIERLTLVNGVAVGLIALAAGGEINIRELQPRMRLLGKLTVTAVLPAGVDAVTLEPSARIGRTRWTIDGTAIGRDRRQTVALN